MAYDAGTTLSLVKARLNRMPKDTSLDSYLTSRIQAAAQKLAESGINLRNDVRDNMFLADYTVWQYQSRDKAGAMPEWLRMEMRERFIQDRGVER